MNDGDYMGDVMARLWFLSKNVDETRVGGRKVNVGSLVYGKVGF